MITIDCMGKVQRLDGFGFNRERLGLRYSPGCGDTTANNIILLGLDLWINYKYYIQIVDITLDLKFNKIKLKKNIIC